MDKRKKEGEKREVKENAWREEVGTRKRGASQGQGRRVKCEV